MAIGEGVRPTSGVAVPSGVTMGTTAGESVDVGVESGVGIADGLDVWVTVGTPTIPGVAIGNVAVGIWLGVGVGVA
jgi:hypothetical protein